MIATASQPVRYRIVIALDRSEYSEIVLEHAFDQAVRHDAPDLHFLTVIDDRSVDIAAAKQWLTRSVLEGLETFRGDRPDWRTRLHVRQGQPAAEIANLAAEVAADLLVIGRFGLHHARGSVADRVLAMVECPTLVVGLSGQAVSLDPPCPACVREREFSDGERWFCSEHASPGRLSLTTLLPPSTTVLHGGPLW